MGYCNPNYRHHTKPNLPVAFNSSEYFFYDNSRIYISAFQQEYNLGEKGTEIINILKRSMWNDNKRIEKEKKRVLSYDIQLEDRDESFLDSLSDFNNMPEDILIQREEKNNFYKAINELSLEYQILIKSTLNNKSQKEIHDEILDKLGIDYAQSVISKHLKKAKEALGQILPKYGIDGIYYH